MHVHNIETEHTNSKNIESLAVKIFLGKADTEAKTRISFLLSITFHPVSQFVPRRGSPHGKGGHQSCYQTFHEALRKPW